MASLAERLDPTQAVARDLKAAFDVKTAEAKERFAEFGRVRRAAIENGAEQQRSFATLRRYSASRVSVSVSGTRSAP